MYGSRLFTELSDEQLIRKAARGDEGAFTKLYRRRQGGIFRFVVQMTGRTEMAEEVTQDVFVTLARDLDSYDAGRGSVTSYLYGIARNHVLRSLERDGRGVSLEEDAVPEPASSDVSPLEGMVRSEEIERVRRAVLALPASYREAVVLCDLQEVSYADAALALGCPVGTVRSKLNRGRALLAEKLRTAKGCLV